MQINKEGILMYRFPNELKDVKKIGLIGLGKTNGELLDYLSRRGGISFTLREDVRSGITDQRIDDYYSGNSVLSDIREQVIIPSPSFKRERRELIEAQARGARVVGDCEMFFENAHSPIFAISGSDGKSTTTELAARLLGASDKRVLKSGNCGRAMTPRLEEEDGACHVVELSSFMLEYCEPKSCSAVITSLSENHLNWHGSFENYLAAKARLLKQAERITLNYDSPEAMKLFRKGSTALISLSASEKELLRRGATHTVTLAENYIILDGARVLNTERLARRESYNIMNIMSAISLTAEHTSPDAIEEALSDFQGLEHRCERVPTSLPFDIYNSSIDSSPQRTAQTMLGLDRRVTLILGGRDKGLSYEPLLSPIARYADAVIIYGENAARLYSALSSSRAIKRAEVKLFMRSSLEEATKLAMAITSRGGAILFSPASVSYDQFKSFEERGCAFKKYISEICL